MKWMITQSYGWNLQWLQHSQKNLWPSHKVPQVCLSETHRTEVAQHAADVNAHSNQTTKTTIHHHTATSLMNMHRHSDITQSLTSVGQSTWQITIQCTFSETILLTATTVLITSIMTKQREMTCSADRKCKHGNKASSLVVTANFGIHEIWLTASLG